MGELKNKHGMTLLGKTPEGTCPECGRAHPVEKPHDQKSLAYQYKFYDKTGRFPTWTDAMSHCSQEVKDYWTKALKDMEVM